MINLSWLQYWKAAGIIAILYYVVVLALFFRGDIKKMLTARHRKKEEADNEATVA